MMLVVQEWGRIGWDMLRALGWGSVVCNGAQVVCGERTANVRPVYRPPVVRHICLCTLHPSHNAARPPRLGGLILPTDIKPCRAGSACSLMPGCVITGMQLGLGLGLARKVGPHGCLAGALPCMLCMLPRDAAVRAAQGCCCACWLATVACLLLTSCALHWQ